MFYYQLVDYLVLHSHIQRGYMWMNILIFQDTEILLYVKYLLYIRTKQKVRKEVIKMQNGIWEGRSGIERGSIAPCSNADSLLHQYAAGQPGCARIFPQSMHLDSMVSPGGQPLR